MTDTPLGETVEAASPKRVHIPLPLRWGDLDALGHVNNASMLRLLEEARLRAFWPPEEGLMGPPTAILEALDPTAGTMTLVARQEIEYLRPVPYSQRPLDVRLWIGRIGGSSIDVCYDVYSAPEAGTPVLYARSTAVIVLVSTETGRPVRLTDAMRAAWTPFLSDPIIYASRR